MKLTNEASPGFAQMDGLLVETGILLVSAI